MGEILEVKVGKLISIQEEIGLERVALKIICNYKNKSCKKYLYADKYNHFSTHFIYETIKNHEYLKEIICKHIINNIIFYKVLVPIKILGSNEYLTPDDFNEFEKQYNTKINDLNKIMTNKKFVGVEKKFYTHGTADNNLKFKTIFMNNFSIFGFFDGEIDISESVFCKSCSYDGFLESNSSFIAENCTFIDNADFRILLKNKHLNNVSFKNSIFTKKLFFSKIKFLENTNFSNCHFKDYADFHECEFEKTASFYGATFDKAPNFSQAIFKGSLNAVNTNLNFTFDNLQEKIKQEYEDFNKNERDKKPLDKFANDFRDSFRVFKNALIKDNNLLDASNFHKYELYCKELELKNKKDKTFKDVVDKYQLFFYRKLCDHHTDLLKVFHNLLIIIMLFSVFSFALDKFKQPSIENNAKYHIVQVDTNESYIFKEYNKTTYNIFGLNINKESGKLDEFIKSNFVYVLILLFIVLPILSFNIFTNLYIFVSFFYVIFNFLDFVALYTHIAIISLFVFFVLKFILLDDKQEIIRKIIIGISYIVCIFALLAKPSLMLPVFGSFLEKDSNATYPLLLSLSVVYFILVALVIFSLQKTARKNSIVPS
ncbi:pentapeptide repeat-containing protein [Campylobacter sp. IFREMER_LSEM_CL2151]|uniref:pentapeptide repeat-containing protein n=1 Tax=Campylobacter sp. IFREMER_LSEM_CL2151 TaxID=2911620 RepID=UPI0021E8BBBA|nr:pentapeptide repeat-containing protein [Campylobacter sp. IFREMER_LSEM_CL2151]MCV3375837.1 pentapeptide repeat-containing protein [Campylobacter sp. IFREMER_LSEM_CL2151]